MEHLYVYDDLRESVYNAYTTSNFMGFNLRYLEPKAIKKIIETNFLEYDEKIIRREIDRISSEFNYRMFYLHT